jgi:hypothetical protein
MVAINNNHLVKNCRVLALVLVSKKVCSELPTHSANIENKERDLTDEAAINLCYVV